MTTKAFFKRLIWISFINHFYSYRFVFSNVLIDVSKKVMEQIAKNNEANDDFSYAVQQHMIYFNNLSALKMTFCMILLQAIIKNIQSTSAHILFLLCSHIFWARQTYVHSSYINQ